MPRTRWSAAAIAIICVAVLCEVEGPARAAPRREPKLLGKAACTAGPRRFDISLLSTSIEAEEEVVVRLAEGEKELDLLPAGDLGKAWYKFHAPVGKSLCDKTMVFQTKAGHVALFKRGMRPRGEELVAVLFDPDAGKVLAALTLGEGGAAGSAGKDAVKALPDGFAYVEATTRLESTECDPDCGSLPDQRRIGGMNEMGLEIAWNVAFKDGAAKKTMDLATTWRRFQGRNPGVLPDEKALREKFGINPGAGTVATRLYVVPQAAKGAACISLGSMNDVTGDWICGKKKR